MRRVLPLIFALAVNAFAIGQSRFGLIDAQTLRIDAGPRAVTVYRGRAAVTRSVRRQLGPGVYELTFEGLPERVQPESLQAHVVGPARVVGVEYVERSAREAASPRVAELDRLLVQNERALARRAEDRELVEAQESFLSALGGRAANATGLHGGTDAIDLEAVSEQLAYFRTERQKLLEERRAIDAEIEDLREVGRRLQSERESVGASSPTARAATVMIAVDGGGEIGIDLIYIVTDATWTPTYNVRAALDGSRVDIEYEALLEQRTGEDWRDVVLSLSTAQPARRASPPALAPVFIDVVDPVTTSEDAAPPGVPGGPGAPSRGSDAPWRERDAAIGATDPTVNYALPRPATITTDARHRQRVRIASIASRPLYTHVAMPLITESVYVRSDLRNESDYQLLPGPVAVFVGGDYVGPTAIDAIAPHEAFEVYFGVDRAVTVKRILVAKETARTGLLGGGRKTSYDYRIEIENGAGKDISLELWDRMPVSRSDRVEVQLVNLSHDISVEPAYLEEQFVQGLLRWDLTVLAGTTDATPSIVSFGVRVARAKEVDVTGLPD